MPFAQKRSRERRTYQLLISSTKSSSALAVSGERGSNENQNKLVRRWIKKGDDIGKFTKQDIRKINDWINQYPRKMFKGLSSQEMLVQHEQNIAVDLIVGIGKI